MIFNITAKSKTRFIYSTLDTS